MKFLRNKKVGFLFGIANNRQVSEEQGKLLPVKDLDIPDEGLVVYLKSFGWVKVFCQPLKNEPRYYITYHQDLEVLSQITRDEFKSLHDAHWQIEVFHRVIKQVCTVISNAFSFVMSGQFGIISFVLSVPSVIFRLHVLIN